ERLGPDFLNGLAQRRSVWVVGDGSDAVAAAWLAMVQRLLGLTGSSDAVRLVHLKMTIPPALKAKGAPIEAMKNPVWVLRNMKWARRSRLGRRPLARLHPDRAGPGELAVVLDGADVVPAQAGGAGLVVGPREGDALGLRLGRVGVDEILDD